MSASNGISVSCPMSAWPTRKTGSTPESNAFKQNRSGRLRQCPKKRRTRTSMTACPQNEASQSVVHKATMYARKHRVRCATPKNSIGWDNNSNIAELRSPKSFARSRGIIANTRLEANTQRVVLELNALQNQVRPGESLKGILWGGRDGAYTLPIKESNYF